MNRHLRLVFLAGSILVSQNTAHAAADIDLSAGERSYAQCGACHSVGYHRTGPKHCGLVGRRAGSVAGYDFTAAMRDSGIVWDKSSLDTFLKAPLKMVPGTSMGYAGMDSAQQRANLIAWLATLNADNPVCR